MMSGNTPEASAIAVPDSFPGDVTRSTDLDQAVDLLTRAYAPHRMVASDTTRFGFELKTIDAERLRIGLTRFSDNVSIEVPPTSTFYVVCYTISGSVRISSGSHTMRATPATAAVMTPTQPWRFDNWNPESVLVAMRIGRADLEDDLATLLGRPVSAPIRFDPQMDLTSRHGSEFVRALQIMHEELRDPHGLGRHPLLASGLAQLVRSSLIVSQPHNYSELLRKPEEAALPRQIRNVVDAVESDPMQFTTAIDLARFACLSLRTLEQGFSEFVGIPPMAFVRKVRLARARDDLLRSDPNQTTVYVVAHRWGFHHMGRFAASYQQYYGELPSATLQAPK
ncbi:AraC family transcriptional regulator [Nocardia africana]